MTFETTALPSFKEQVKAPVDYHTALFGDGKLWIFSLTYVDQKTFHYGHRVQYTGGYAVAYDPATKAYEAPVEVPAISDIENGAEQLFTYAGSIYLLLTVAFSETPEFLGLYRWTGTSWESKASFTDIDTIVKREVTDAQQKVTWALANGDHEGNVYVLAAAGLTIEVYQLNIEAGTVQKLADVSEEANPLRGRPVGGFVLDGALYISYGVHGCGFRWERNNFIKVDLATKAASDHGIESEGAPKFCFGGPYVTALNKKGDWLTVCGATQVGMTGSEFNSDIWALGENATTWKKLDISAPEGKSGDFIGAYDYATQTVYIVNNDGVSTATL